eukprot:gene9499-10493_t
MVRLSFSRKRRFSHKSRNKTDLAATLSSQARSAYDNDDDDSDEEGDDLKLDLIKRRAIDRWSSFTPGCTVLISSRNPLEDFHRLFPSLPTGEFPLNVFTCALSKEILLQGKMFVSQNWICFYSNIFGYETKEMIEIRKILALRRERTVFVVPNAISMRTKERRYFFCSFLSRETVFRLLSRIWKAAIRDKKLSDSDGDIEDSKPNMFDDTDLNDNSTRNSISEYSFDTRASFSDKDLAVFSYSTPIFPRRKIHVYPAVLCKNGLRKVGGSKVEELGLNDSLQLCKWNTEADLRDLKIVKYNRAARLWRKKRDLRLKNDSRHTHYRCKIHPKTLGKAFCNYATKALNYLRKRVANCMTLNWFISIIIIILGLMSLFLFYKINNLSQIFDDKNDSYSPLCKANRLQLPLAERYQYSSKLKRVNDIISSNLKAVYEVQDSLKKLKKNLDPQQ